jgi:hypothetical protein
VTSQTSSGGCVFAGRPSESAAPGARWRLGFGRGPRRTSSSRYRRASGRRSCAEVRAVRMSLEERPGHPPQAKSRESPGRDPSIGRSHGKSRARAVETAPPCQRRSNSGRTSRDHRPRRSDIAPTTGMTCLSRTVAGDGRPRFAHAHALRLNTATGRLERGKRSTTSPRGRGCSLR